MYHIPDLQLALADYLQHITDNVQGPLDIKGQHLSQANCYLPFDRLEVWEKVYLQSKAYHHPHTILPAQSVNALLPLSSSSLGQFDNRVVHGSHFRAIFESFSISFSVHFQSFW